MVIFPVIDARINEATVNNSRTVYSALVFNTFDNEGNYNKTDWQDYQLISEQLMDKIEDGIYWNRYDLNSKYDNVIVEESEDEIELTFYSFGKKLKTISFSRGSKDYNDLINTPIIPTKVSELENDNGYLTEIPSEYITEEELNAKDLPTKEYVDEAILQAQLKEEEIDLSDYARKTYVDEGLATKSDKDHTHEYLTEIPSEYITETELNAKGYLTEHQDLSDYVTEEELEFKDYPTKGWVNDSIIQAQLGETDMSNFAPINNPKFVNSISLGRKSDSTTGIYSVALGLNTTATQLHSIALGYGATSTGLGSMALGYGAMAINNYQIALGKYNQLDTMNKYALIYGNGTSDDDRKNIHTLDFNGNAWFLGNVSVDGTPTNNNDLVTKSYVDTAIENIDISNDLSNYATQTFVNNKLTNYYTKKETNEEYVTYGNMHTVLNQEYARITYVDEAISNIEINGVDLSSYATKTYVDEAIANIELGNIDLSDYATKNYVIEEITKAQLSGEDGEINLSGYVTFTELDNRDYATETYVDNAIANAQLGGDGSIDLSRYAPINSPVFTGSITLGTRDKHYTGIYGIEKNSLTVGEEVFASENSLAVGVGSTTYFSCSFAQGYYSDAWFGSHAHGLSALAIGDFSHAEGGNTYVTRKSDFSHAEGLFTTTYGISQHVQGIGNIEDIDERYAFIVGNGEYDYIQPTIGFNPSDYLDHLPYGVISGMYALKTRSNAHTLDWNGNAWYAGELYVGGDSQDNANKVFSTKDIYFDSNGYLCVTINGVTKKFAPIN